MKHVRKIALAACAFSSAALLSFAWSEQSGLSLSVESAQARVGRPLTPVSVAGVCASTDATGRVWSRRSRGRRGRGWHGGSGRGDITLRGWGSSYYNDPGYSSGSGPYAAYGYSPEDWRRRNGIVCEPGTMTKLDDGRMYRCQ